MTLSTFYTTQDPSQQDEAREAMTQQHLGAELDMLRQGITPPWLDPSTILDNDQRLLLAHIADHGKAYWGGRSDCRAVADVMGFVSVNNARTSVARCIDRGLISSGIDGNRGVLRLTMYGRIILDVVEMEDEL